MKKSFNFIQKGLSTLMNVGKDGILSKEVNQSLNATYGCGLKPRCYPQLIALCIRLLDCKTLEDSMEVLKLIELKVKEAKS